MTETAAPVETKDKEPKNRPWTRPTIELALDIRSWERVVLFTEPTSDYEYPPGWQRPSGLYDAHIDGETVVIFDRIDFTKKTLVSVVAKAARMIGICPIDVDHERFVRRVLTDLYPFTEVWTVSTAFGKVLMASPVGAPYDRDKVIDERPRAGA